MIFAAGIGKRLGDITITRPKALVEINGKSILRIAVEKVSSYGFDEIIINIHHFADMVKDEINKLVKDGYLISVSDERDHLLETGGGLFKAQWFFDDKPFLLYNTDIISDLDLGALYRFHNADKKLATLAVSKRDHDRIFLVNNNGLVCGWMNRRTGEKIISRIESGPLSEIAFSGIHVVDPEIFTFMKEGIYSMTSLYLNLAASQRICTYRHDSDFWADIGTPEELRQVKKRFEEPGY